MIHTVDTAQVLEFTTDYFKKIEEDRIAKEQAASQAEIITHYEDMHDEEQEIVDSICEECDDSQKPFAVQAVNELGFQAEPG